MSQETITLPRSEYEQLTRKAELLDEFRAQVGSDEMIQTMLRTMLYSREYDSLTASGRTGYVKRFVANQNELMDRILMLAGKL